jgi:hypothetical protein
MRIIEAWIGPSRIVSRVKAPRAGEIAHGHPIPGEVYNLRLATNWSAREQEHNQRESQAHRLP